MGCKECNNRNLRIPLALIKNQSDILFKNARLLFDVATTVGTDLSKEIAVIRQTDNSCYIIGNGIIIKNSVNSKDDSYKYRLSDIMEIYVLAQPKSVKEILEEVEHNSGDVDKLLKDSILIFNLPSPVVDLTDEIWKVELDRLKSVMVQLLLNKYENASLIQKARQNWQKFLQQKESK